MIGFGLSGGRVFQSAESIDLGWPSERWRSSWEVTFHTLLSFVLQMVFPRYSQTSWFLELPAHPFILFPAKLLAFILNLFVTDAIPHLVFTFSTKWDAKSWAFLPVSIKLRFTINISSPSQISKVKTFQYWRLQQDSKIYGSNLNRNYWRHCNRLTGMKYRLHNWYKNAFQ